MVYKGNKSAFARRLGFEQKEIYRFLKQYHNGGGSAIATEAVLRLFAEENISVDTVLHEYASVDAAGEDGRCVHQDHIDNMLLELSALREQKCGTDMRYALAQDAIRFMEKLREHLCSEQDKQNRCRYYRHEESDDTCPCKDFAKFFAAISANIEEAWSLSAAAGRNCA